MVILKFFGFLIAQIFTLTFFYSYAFAGVQVHDYERVLRQATERNSSVIELQEDIRFLNIDIRDADEAYLALLNFDRPAALAIRRNRDSLIAQRDALALELGTTRASIELSLRSVLANIARTESDIASLQDLINLREATLEAARLRYEYGAASASELRDAELALEQSVADMRALPTSLLNLNIELNLLTNYPLDRELIVVYEITQRPELPEDLERFINETVNNNPALQNARNRVGLMADIWQEQLDDPNEDNDANRLNHRISQIERDLAQMDAENLARAAVLALERLYERENGLLNDLEEAQNAHAAMQERYDAGLVTQMFLMQTELGVSSAERALTLLEYDFWLAEITLNFPHVRLR